MYCTPQPPLSDRSHLMLTIEYWLSYLWFLYDVCTVHVYSIPCFAEILSLISCQLASLEAYQKMLNRYWVFESTKRLESSPLNFKSQVSILYQLPKVCEIRRGFSYQNERRASVGLLFTRLVFLSTLEYVGMSMQFPEWWPTLRWSRKLPNVIVSGS